MSVKITKLKKQPRKSSKTICFDCRTYTHLKKGKCNTCGSTEATAVGIAFRPPAKDRIKPWEAIREAWHKQMRRRAEGTSEYQAVSDLCPHFFFAFRKEEFRDPVICTGKRTSPITGRRTSTWYADRLPRKIRERAVIAEIR